MALAAQPTASKHWRLINITMSLLIINIMLIVLSTATYSWTSGSDGCSDKSGGDVTLSAEPTVQGGTDTGGASVWLTAGGGGVCLTASSPTGDGFVVTVIHATLLHKTTPVQLYSELCNPITNQSQFHWHSHPSKLKKCNDTHSIWPTHTHKKEQTRKVELAPKPHHHSNYHQHLREQSWQTKERDIIKLLESFLCKHAN